MAAKKTNLRDMAAKMAAKGRQCETYGSICEYLWQQK
jgi:hypothetical protein